MIIAWATYRNSDMTEGRGPMVLDKVFIDESDAHAYINQKKGVSDRHPAQFGLTDWQSSGMGDWKVEPLHIFENLVDAEVKVINDNLESAYAKLTPAEKSAIEAHVRSFLT